MGFLDDVAAAEAAKGTPTPAPAPTPADIATPAPTPNPPAPTPQQDAVQQVLDQNTPKPTDTIPAPNLNIPTFEEHLDKMSGGTLKDETSLKEALARIKDYDTLATEKADLEAKMAQAPKFVDDEVRIYNELKAGGASKEQLSAFFRLNEVGDMKDLSAKDTIITKMVLVDGVKPGYAARKLEKDFNFNDDNMTPEEIEDRDQELELQAKSARKEIAKFKAEVTKTNTISPEEQKLQYAAQVQDFTTRIRPYVKEVVDSVEHMGIFNLNGKLDDKGKPTDESIIFAFPFDKEAKEKMAEYVENFFIDGFTQPTAENTRLAMNFARAEFIRENINDFAEKIGKHVESVVTERMVNKYENRSGLKPNEDNPAAANATNPVVERGKFMEKVANRTV